MGRLLLDFPPGFVDDLFRQQGYSGQVDAHVPDTATLAAERARAVARWRARLVHGLEGAELTAANATIDAFVAAVATFATTYDALNVLWKTQNRKLADAGAMY